MRTIERKNIDETLKQIERFKTDNNARIFSNFDFRDYTSAIEELQAAAGDGIKVTATSFGLEVRKVG